MQETSSNKAKSRAASANTTLQRHGKAMEQNSVISEKERHQQRLLSTHDFTYLGNGPSATGTAWGWRMSPDLYFKCIVCGYLMQAKPNHDDDYFCGALSQDASWGRFGSRLGDQAVEVYRGVSKAAHY